MTITAPTLDTITGNTVMVKMRELIKQMTTFAKEVADLVNTIPTDIQDTYSKDAIDDMIDGLDSAIATLYDSVYPKSDVYTKNDVYTKSETDNLVNPKANADDVYTKSEVYTKNETDALVNPKANANNVYTKSEVYTKTETDTLIFPKANSSDVYNKTEIDNFLSSKQDELTAGTGISIVNDVISATGGSGNVQIIQAEITRRNDTEIIINGLTANDMVFVQGQVHIGTSDVIFSVSFIPQLDGSITGAYMFPIDLTSAQSSSVYDITTYLTATRQSDTSTYMRIISRLSNPSFLTYKALIIRSVA